jgi:hypothetical protein
MYLKVTAPGRQAGSLLLSWLMSTLPGWRCAADRDRVHALRHRVMMITLGFSHAVVFFETHPAAVTR